MQLTSSDSENETIKRNKKLCELSKKKLVKGQYKVFKYSFDNSSSFDENQLPKITYSDDEYAGIPSNQGAFNIVNMRSPLVRKPMGEQINILGTLRKRSKSNNKSQSKIPSKKMKQTKQDKENLV